MLRRQYFCWRHQTALEAVVCGQQHTQQRYNGLAASHIALQQTVHLLSARCVKPYFFQYPFLRIRKLKRKVLFVEGIEVLPAECRWRCILTSFILTCARKNSSNFNRFTACS